MTGGYKTVLVAHATQAELQKQWTNQRIEAPLSPQQGGIDVHILHRHLPVLLLEIGRLSTVMEEIY